MGCRYSLKQLQRLCLTNTCLMKNLVGHPAGNNQTTLLKAKKLFTPTCSPILHLKPDARNSTHTTHRQALSILQTLASISPRHLHQAKLCRPLLLRAVIMLHSKPVRSVAILETSHVRLVTVK